MASASSHCIYSVIHSSLGNCVYVDERHYTNFVEEISYKKLGHSEIDWSLISYITVIPKFCEQGMK